ncbi:MAG: 4-hydroxy-tetrahydrodipicolinate synthase [Verrucomicrobiota bacterium]
MLSGTYTAIVTPFQPGGAVDFEAFRMLLERQLEGNVDGIVPAGTTGESPTLDYEEHIKVIETTVEKCKGRAKVIAGTGSNSTREAVSLTEHAKKAGVDATLQVTPYYNKPSQEGLYRHFSEVADVGLPVVLYNVPGRTGREIAIETIARLAEHPNIVAVKEAGGSVDRVSATVNTCDLDVLSGDDSLTLPMMAVGGKGVISVASNICPGAMSEMTHAALEGKWDKARELHAKYYTLFCQMFLESNPIPVKAALALKGLIEEAYRLPLCEMADDKKALLRETLLGLDELKL